MSVSGRRRKLGQVSSRTRSPTWDRHTKLYHNTPYHTSIQTYKLCQTVLRYTTAYQTILTIKHQPYFYHGTPKCSKPNSAMIHEIKLYRDTPKHMCTVHHWSLARAWQSVNFGFSARRSLIDHIQQIQP